LRTRTHWQALSAAHAQGSNSGSCRLLRDPQGGGNRGMRSYVMVFPPLLPAHRPAIINMFFARMRFPFDERQKAWYNSEQRNNESNGSAVFETIPEAP